MTSDTNTLGGGKPCDKCYSHAGVIAKVKGLCKFEGDIKAKVESMDDKIEGRVSMRLFCLLIVVLMAVCGSIFMIGWANYQQNQANNKDIAVVQQQLKQIAPITVP